MPEEDNTNSASDRKEIQLDFIQSARDSITRAIDDIAAKALAGHESNEITPDTDVLVEACELAREAGELSYYLFAETPEIPAAFAGIPWLGNEWGNGFDDAGRHERCMACLGCQDPNGAICDIHG